MASEPFTSRFEGVVYVNDRPCARLVINETEYLISEPDALSELSSTSRKAVAELLHFRLHAAHLRTTHVTDKETHAPPADESPSQAPDAG